MQKTSKNKILWIFITSVSRIVTKKPKVAIYACKMLKIEGGTLGLEKMHSAGKILKGYPFVSPYFFANISSWFSARPETMNPCGKSALTTRPSD